MKLRRLVHGLGFRYRLHVGKLPGTPDLVFPRLKSVIFMHGCFWHRHPDPSCKLARLPKSRTKFWRAKLEGNSARDYENLKQLRDMGWRALVVWECELSDPEQVGHRVREFLSGGHKLL